jgi:hypothetical protein
VTYQIPDRRWEAPELLRQWTKPARELTVDWSHPITRKMVGCYVFNGRRLTNLANPTEISKNTVLSSSEGEFRQNDIFFDPATHDGVFVDLSMKELYPVGSAMVAGYTSVNGWCFFFEGGVDGSGIRLATKTDNDRIYFETGNTQWLIQNNFTGNADPNIISVTWDDANNRRTYISNDNSGTSTASFSAPSLGLQLKLGARVTYNDLCCERCYFQYFWKRLISPAEDAALRLDPYQILMPA